MKIIKRISALILVAVMVLSLAACHKKNEIAVTVGDIEFTSAYYMCALIAADSEAKNLVYEELSDEEKSGYETPDYYSHKVEGKDFVEWVEETALNNLKKIGAYKMLCKENKLEIEEEERTNAETYAQYYWSSYGYSAYYEPNGVAYETYKNFTVDSYYSELYFEHIYGEEGTKAISADDVKNKLYENYVIAEVLEAAFETDATDDDKATLKTKVDDYAAALNAGTMTFEQVYNDYNGTTAEDTATEDAEEDHDHEGEDAEEEEETLEPLSQYANVFGAEGTETYESDYYDTVKAMAVGEVKVIELEDEAGYALFVKRDIQADPYYLDSLDMAVRHLIADDEFEADIDKYIDGLTVDVSKYAIGQFKVKKIVEPTYS